MSAARPKRAITLSSEEAGRTFPSRNAGFRHASGGDSRADHVDADIGGAPALLGQDAGGDLQGRLLRGYADDPGKSALACMVEMSTMAPGVEAAAMRSAASRASRMGPR